MHNFFQDYFVNAGYFTNFAKKCEYEYTVSTDHTIQLSASWFDKHAVASLFCIKILFAEEWYYS